MSAKTSWGLLHIHISPYVPAHLLINTYSAMRSKSSNHQSIEFLFTESVKCFQKWLKKVDSNPSPRRKSSVWCCRTQSCRLVDGWNRRNVFWSCSPRYWFPIRTRKLSTVILFLIKIYCLNPKLSLHGIYIPNGCKHFEVLYNYFMGMKQTLITGPSQGLKIRGGGGLLLPI